jgi:hypothetical protein
MIRREILGSILAMAAAAGRASAQTPAVSAFAVPRDYSIDGYFARDKEPARLYRTRRAIRYQAREAGIEHVVVARFDLDRAWLSLPALGVNFETGLSDFGLSPQALSGQGFVERAMGRETLDGVATTKLRITRTADDPAFDGFAWVDAGGILMRLQGAGDVKGNGGTVDWRFANPNVGPFDSALLEAPAGRIVPVAGDALLALLRRFGLIR